MTKRVLSIILSLILALSLCVCAFAEETAKVVEIATADDLYTFAERVNSGERDLDAVLTDNIIVNETVFDENGDLTEDTVALRAWTPAGAPDLTSDHPDHDYAYKGTFDGKGFYISGLYYDTEDGTGGIFWTLGENATVKNLGVINSYFKGDTLGAIAGLTENYVTIENCYSDCFITGDVYEGGIAGTLGGSSLIKNCYSLGTTSSPAYAGGLVGVSWGIIEDSFSYGKVLTDTDTVYIGGICGLSMGGITKNSYFNKTAFGGTAVGTAEYDSVVENTTGKTKYAFTSGEVAYLLQNGQEDSVWGQNIDNGEIVSGYPQFNAGRVYTGTNCKGGTIYTNYEDVTGEHSYKDGNCIYCYKYEPQGNSSPAVSSITLTVFAFIEALLNFLSSFFA